MKTTMMNLTVAAAMSFGGTALAAGEAGKAQPMAPASAVPAAPTATKEAPPAPARPVEVKPPRPKNLDLRHCLELETDAAIAKCAGE